MSVTLGDLAPSKRVGSTVLHNGEHLVVWNYAGRWPVWLWRPDASLVELTEREALGLELVTQHPIYLPGRRDCVRRNEHLWPTELTPDAECSRCALRYGDFQEPTDD